LHNITCIAAICQTKTRTSEKDGCEKKNKSRKYNGHISVHTREGTKTIMVRQVNHFQPLNVQNYASWSPSLLGTNNRISHTSFWLASTSMIVICEWTLLEYIAQYYWTSNFSALAELVTSVGFRHNISDQHYTSIQLIAYTYKNHLSRLYHNYRSTTKGKSFLVWYIWDNCSLYIHKSSLSTQQHFSLRQSLHETNGHFQHTKAQ